MAVLTGMVKREQVYRPSSPSVTSLMLMVNSDDVARTSSIRLSLKAAYIDTNREEIEQADVKYTS